MGSRDCVATGSLCAYPYAPEIHPPSLGFLLPGSVPIVRKEDCAPMATRLPMRYPVADSSWGESEIEEEDGLSRSK